MVKYIIQQIIEILITRKMIIIKQFFNKVLLFIKDFCLSVIKGIIWINTFYLVHFRLISLILILVLVIIFAKYNIIITNTLESILINIASFLFILSFVLCYLDGF